MAKAANLKQILTLIDKAKVIRIHLKSIKSKAFETLFMDNHPVTLFFLHDNDYSNILFW